MEWETRTVMTPHPLDSVRRYLKVPYALRRVPASRIATRLPLRVSPTAGEIALARVEKIGKNARIELASGRPSTLHVGDALAVVFGNRYATAQFEGYARQEDDRCDLLSMGGLCGIVVSKHAGVPDPTRLRLLGMLGDEQGRPLLLEDFALPTPRASLPRPNVIVVCGTSMDAGKTHTAFSLIRGLRQSVSEVAGIKLTGTAAGRDTWAMLDAGACAALDFVDGGLGSTYLCPLDRLLALHELLLGHAAAAGASWVVMEIADGVLQGETSALLRCDEFVRTVDAWVFAAADPLCAEGGLRVLRSCGIEPVALSGLVSTSPLAVREAEAATGLPCFTTEALQSGALTRQLLERPSRSLA